MTTTFPLTLSGPGEAGGFVVVRLRPTWTMVHRISADVAIEVLQQDPPGANLRFVVKVDQPVDTLELDLHYLLEPPELQAHHWFDAKTLAVVLGSGQPFWAAVRTRVQAQVMATPGAPPQALLADKPIRDEYAQRRADGLRHGSPGRRFFDQLDEATYVPLLLEDGSQPKKDQAIALQQLVNYLSFRVRQRAVCAANGQRLVAMRRDGLYVDQLRTALQLMGPAFRTHAGGTAIDPAALSRFVFDYVTGRIVYNPPGAATNVHAAPNSANFFMFAELFYLVRDLEQDLGVAGLDWRYWKDAVRPFVVGAQVFTQLNWSGCGRRESHYAWRHRRGTAFDLPQWRDLDGSIERPGEHRPPDELVEEFFARTLLHALRESARRPPASGVVAAAWSAEIAEDLTLEPLCSDAGGQQFNPSTIPGLQTFWDRFTACVDGSGTVADPGDPNQWHAAICAHMQDTILPCAGSSGDFHFANPSHCVDSRQGNSGWEELPGGAHFAVEDNAGGQWHFGCEVS